MAIRDGQWPGLAILRRCQRCGEWRELSAFRPLGKVCERCIYHGTANGRIARARSIVPVRHVTEAG